MYSWTVELNIAGKWRWESLKKVRIPGSGFSWVSIIPTKGRGRGDYCYGSLAVKKESVYSIEACQAYSHGPWQ